jgi:hypothetical protein
MQKKEKKTENVQSTYFIKKKRISHMVQLQGATSKETGTEQNRNKLHRVRFKERRSKQPTNGTENQRSVPSFRKKTNFVPVESKGAEIGVCVF